MCCYEQSKVDNHETAGSIIGYVRHTMLENYLFLSHTKACRMRLSSYGIDMYSNLKLKAFFSIGILLYIEKRSPLVSFTWKMFGFFL